MSTLQEQPTPALVIHPHGKQYGVLPAGVDPNGDVARDQYLLISSRKACQAFVNERQALAEAHAAAAPRPTQSQAATRVDLPVIEIQHVQGEGHYVLLNQKQVARFDGPTAYDDATRCCAVLVQNEINKLDQQQQPYQVRDGNTGRVLSGHPTIEDANEVAFSIENGAPYAGVPAANLAVEFWQRQPDGNYKQMTPEQVERGLEAGKPELAEHEQYRRELVERARAAYPTATPELAARIDKEITRRVEMVRGYQAHLEKAAVDHFPNATPAEKASHQENIRRETKEYRVALEKHIAERREHKQQEQAQQQPSRARQQQGRGHSISR
jgi:hypothetical protein